MKLRNASLLSFLLAIVMVAGLLPITAYASNQNISGLVYASTIPDNSEIMLSGDTTLVMDVSKTIQSITGRDYALTIQGSKTLIVNNSNSTCAIDVSSFTSSAPLNITSSNLGLLADKDIKITGGSLTVKNAHGDGVSSYHGNITINCTAVINSYENALHTATVGNIIVSGNLTAESINELSAVILASGDLSLTGGTIKLTSANSLAIIAVRNITFGGDVTINCGTRKKAGNNTLYMPVMATS